MNGIYKIVSALPELELANPSKNAGIILDAYAKAAKDGAACLVLPRLALTGCTCGSLFNQPLLLNGAMDALERLRQGTDNCSTILTAGLPIPIGNAVLNATAVLQNGKILGIATSMSAPPFFSSSAERLCNHLPGTDIPLGDNLVFQAENLTFAVIDYNDLLMPDSPADKAALAGAQLIISPAAIQALPLVEDKTKQDILAAARRLSAVIAVSSTGSNETVTDALYSGLQFIATPEYCTETNAAETALDIVPAWIDYQRRNSHFGNCSRTSAAINIKTSEPPQQQNLAALKLAQLPFVPEKREEQQVLCDNVLEIQARALARRVQSIHAKRLVLGLSGGLDSTLALLACAKCARLIGQSPDFVLAVTMPGMGTSKRTRSNAETIAVELKAELREIPIGEAVKQHFKDIAHDAADLNVVYENAQARERTQILMDLANEVGGIVVGTGDLSETALGWCTFNGDQMSMYSLNGSIPKTLIRAIVERQAALSGEPLATALKDINATPVSPELLPGAQNTEDIIGNYDVHDFLLYHLLQHGSTPLELYEMACAAFEGKYSQEKILSILALFGKRFLTQQFKRNASPDGIQAGMISLSPRGGWSAPSDINPAIWQNSSAPKADSHK